MARFALVEDNVVTTVIVASPEFVAAQRFSVVRVRWPEDPPDPSAITTRDCEPGSAWDGTKFTRPPPQTKTREELLEERVAALERNPPPAGATLEERIAALESRTR